MKTGILIVVFLFALISWGYFLIGAYKVIVDKDRSFLQFTSSLLIISGMLTSLFFLVLRVFYGH